MMFHPKLNFLLKPPSRVPAWKLQHHLGLGRHVGPRLPLQENQVGEDTDFFYGLFIIGNYSKKNILNGLLLGEGENPYQRRNVSLFPPG